MKSAKAIEALLLPGFYQVGLEDSKQRAHITEMCHAAYLIGIAEERDACASRVAELEAALLDLVNACDFNDVYEEDKSDRPAMLAARRALPTSDKP